jgi:hypothetical protein
VGRKEKNKFYAVSRLVSIAHEIISSPPPQKQRGAKEEERERREWMKNK